MNRLSAYDPDIAKQIAQASQIVAFRNVLIHGYDLIDDGRVWDTIQADVPRLEQQVQALLRQGEP